MEQVGQMLLMVLAALTVENVFLSRGMGFYEILHGAKKGKNIAAYALLLASFSVGSGVLTHWIAGWFPMMETHGDPSAPGPVVQEVTLLSLHRGAASQLEVFQ